MTHGNPQALAGEYLAADSAIAQVDRGLGAIKLPSVVIQGDADKFVEPVYGRRIAAGFERQVIGLAVCRSLRAERKG